jgi:hypothetical protein
LEGENEIGAPDATVRTPPLPNSNQIQIASPRFVNVTQ